MKIELHVIQNFAPSCLNRDDTNTPKDCDFGGYRRARISSQCYKRAVRTSSFFSESLEGTLGIRTKLLLQEISRYLVELGRDENDIKKVAPAFIEQFSGMDGDKTKVLLYLGRDEIQRMCVLLNSKWDELLAASQTLQDDGSKAKGKSKKSEQNALQKLAAEIAKGYKPGTNAVDIALFGRMVAEDPSQNIEAACQIAHAISTHKVNMEMDFYTAVDDLLSEDETGAGMMGTTEFNSACFYRYALVDFDQLKKNLNGDDSLSKIALESFVKSFALSIPNAKQNSMAAQNLPSFIMAVVRDSGAPWSLANAFERPISPSLKGFTGQSIEELDRYWGRLSKVYGANGIKDNAVCLLEDIELNNLADRRVESLDRLVEKVKEAIS